jgi:hypothetical protein
MAGIPQTVILNSETIKKLEKDHSSKLMIKPQRQEMQRFL